MVSQLKKRPELHYAYSLLGNKNINKGEKEINFAKLNKGFYDKLINIDNEIKTSRDSLKTIKTNGIKELIYSNRQIPSTWKNKIGYYNDLYKTINQDQRFLFYLGKGCPDTSRNRDEKETIPGSLFEEGRGYSSSDLLKNNPKLTQSFGLNTVSETNNILIRRKTTKTSFLEGNQKRINEILEDYKISYPLELKNQPGDDLPQLNNQLNKNASCDKSHRTLNMSRSDVFKSTIYSNLIPNHSNMSPKSGTHLIKKQKETQKTLYGPFLNFDYASLNKKIEISNMKVKKNLEDINNFGPYYSHCPSCSNKNLEFYETMEPGQCLKLLQQLKKIRNKKQ